MQATSSVRTIRKSGVEVLLLVAVAAVALGIGRWVVPATDSAHTVVYGLFEAPEHVRSAPTTQVKLAQMDAADDLKASLNSSREATTHVRAAPTMKAKLVQMDAVDDLIAAMNSDAHAGIRAEPSMEVKLAQMDAADDLIAAMNSQ